MRLFVAVDLPPEVVELVDALERPRLAQLRWTTEEQWHVTLRFLGEVPDSELPAVRAALDHVPRALSPALTDGGLEAVLGPAVAWFPGRQVLQAPVGGLEALADAVADATADWGEPAEPHFRGHLTLARVRDRRPGPGSLAGPPLVASWEVGELVLYASTLGPGGSRYEAVHRVAL